METTTAIVNLSSKPRASRPGQAPTSDSLTLGGRRMSQRSQIPQSISPDLIASTLDQLPIASYAEGMIGACHTLTIDVIHHQRTLTIRLVWQEKSPELNRSMPSWQPHHTNPDERMLVVEGRTLLQVRERLAQEIAKISV